MTDHPDDQSEIDHVPSPEEILAAEQEEQAEAAKLDAAADETAALAQSDTEPAPADPPEMPVRRAFICETTMAWLSPGSRDATFIQGGTEGSWTQAEIDSLLAQGAKLRPVMPTKAEKIAVLKAQMAEVEAGEDDPEAPALPTEPVPEDKPKAPKAARKPKAPKAGK